MATKDKKTDNPEEEFDPESPTEEDELPSPPPTLPTPPPPPTQNTQKPTKPADRPGGFCVYLGPSIQGVIYGGTIYKNDKATTLDELAPAVEKYPLIASLIVPGVELPKSRLDVKQAGSLLYANYSKLAGIIKNK